MSEPTTEQLRLAKEAVDDWAEIASSIAGRLMSSAEHFRLGEDAQAVEALRAAVEDLGAFVLWIGEIRDILDSAGDPTPDADRLQQGLAVGARSVREALARQDFVGAADEIEGSLVAQLMGSGALADRMLSVIEQRATP